MKREKLTLRLERDLIEKAKRVAEERETSVSRMVAGFFDNLESPPSRDGGTARSPAVYAARSSPGMVSRRRI
jgi:hypothetical protein